MIESLRHSLQERRHGRCEAKRASITPFRSHFALEEEDSSQIYPCAAGESPQLIFPLASVVGLVVPCVKAELEDGGFDIVPFVLLFLGDNLQALAGPHRLQLLGEEVSPLEAAAFVRIGYPKSSAPGPLGFIDLACLGVGNPDRVPVTLVQQIAGLTALDAGEPQAHGCRRSGRPRRCRQC